MLTKIFIKNYILIDELELDFSEGLNIITGETGAGKSSLLNLLNPELNIETNEISEALGRGKHTTRHVELYEISDGYVADTPGFSALDLKDMNKEQLRDTFI